MGYSNYTALTEHAMEVSAKVTAAINAIVKALASPAGVRDNTHWIALYTDAYDALQSPSITDTNRPTLVTALMDGLRQVPAARRRTYTQLTAYCWRVAQQTPPAVAAPKF